MESFEWLPFVFHVLVCVPLYFQSSSICDGLGHEGIIIDFLLPLSCSMTSGKSGLWCDANLSCLRISTPQKPWSPTAELKTCWPLTMDSRTLYLPASGSAAPSTIHRYGHPFCIQVSEWHRYPTLGLPSIFPTMSLPTILICPSFLKPASLRFLLSQVFYFIFWVHPHYVLRVLPFLPTSFFLFPPCHPVHSLSVWNLGAWTPQHWFFHSSLELCS